MKKFNKNKDAKDKKDLTEVKKPIRKISIQACVWSTLLGIVIGCGMVASVLISTSRELRKRIDMYDLSKIEAEQGKEEAESTKIQLIKNMIEADSLYGYVDNNKLQELKYKHLMWTLDDKYATYYTKAETDNMDDMSGETYVGIGITVTIDEATDMCKVVDVIEGGPTDKAGIKAGDFIIKIDGKSVDTYSPIDAVDMINKAGENFNITVSRLDEKKNSIFKTFEIQKEEIERKYVTYENDEDIAYISLDAFSGNCYEQFREAINTAIKSNKNGIIIDLRKNMGGSIDAAKKIAGMFVGHSDICYLQFKPDKNGEERKEILYGSSSKVTKLQELPIAIIINESTASASELLCGSLRKKLDNIILIGNTTYGKGIAQRIEKLSDGSSIKMTVAEYYLFDGTKVNGVGIEPDIVNINENEQYKLAKEYIKSKK